MPWVYEAGQGWVWATSSRAKKGVTPETAAQVWARDRGMCQGCHKMTDLHIHHKKYRSRGGSHALANLVLLCLTCHTDTHAGEKGMARFRTSRYQNEGESEVT